jgi:hypothetical protein
VSDLALVHVNCAFEELQHCHRILHRLENTCMQYQIDI